MQTLVVAVSVLVLVTLCQDASSMPGNIYGLDERSHAIAMCRLEKRTSKSIICDTSALCPDFTSCQLILRRIPIPYIDTYECKPKPCRSPQDCPTSSFCDTNYSLCMPRAFPSWPTADATCLDELLGILSDTPTTTPSVYEVPWQQRGRK